MMLEQISIDFYFKSLDNQKAIYSFEKHKTTMSHPDLPASSGDTVDGFPMFLTLRLHVHTVHPQRLHLPILLHQHSPHRVIEPNL